MVSATILTLVIIPSVYLLVNGWRLEKRRATMDQ
jgi:Cu/Ag efflux pump CusA